MSEIITKRPSRIGTIYHAAEIAEKADRIKPTRRQLINVTATLLGIGTGLSLLARLAKIAEGQQGHTSQDIQSILDDILNTKDTPIRVPARNLRRYKPTHITHTNPFVGAGMGQLEYSVFTPSRTSLRNQLRGSFQVTGLTPNGDPDTFSWRLNFGTPDTFVMPYAEEYGFNLEEVKEGQANLDWDPDDFHVILQSHNIDTLPVNDRSALVGFVLSPDYAWQLVADNPLEENLPFSVEVQGEGLDSQGNKWHGTVYYDFDLPPGLNISGITEYWWLPAYLYSPTVTINAFSDLTTGVFYRSGLEPKRSIVDIPLLRR